MAKRTITPGNSELGFEESEAEDYSPQTFVDVTPPVISVRKLVLLQPLRLKINGPVTGQLYEFPCAGSILDVDARDAEIMLLKRQKSSCCGSDPGYYFQLVGG